ncbi:MAG TPA: hypothetical protein VHB79_08800 [Polyangiaceae bacterium]|nr:hypothetical protein [Polyangiaceae bacterium]
MTRRQLPSDPLLWLRESAEPSPPDGVEARLAARLEGLSAPVALGGATPGAVPPRAALVHTKPPSGGGFKLLAERFVRWSLVPLGLGVGLGAAAHAVRGGEQLHPQPALPVVLTATTASSVPSADAGSQPPSVVDVVLSPAVAAPSTMAAKSTLVVERDLLDRARRQLASDEPARALAFLEQHAQRFPRGQLSEEREAMWVNVLALLGRSGEAKARGEAFEARFPNSLMGSSVRAAVRAAGSAR